MIEHAGGNWAVARSLECFTLLYTRLDDVNVFHVSVSHVGVHLELSESIMDYS